MITLFNTFNVHGDDTAEFERVFRDTATFLSRQPGFRGYQLVRSTVESKRYFNVGSWESAEDLHAALALPEMRAHHEELSQLASTDPHPCTTVATVSMPGTGEGSAHGGAR